VMGAYVPLPLLSFAIEYKLFGYDPFAFHFTNLALHIINTVLVFRLFRLLKLDILPAAIATLLWGIHPMRVESVAWVTERKDMLYTLFFLPSVILYIRYIQQNERRVLLYLLSLLLFTFALLSKIQAVALPLCLLALDYYYERPLNVKLILEKIPYFLLALIIGVVGIFVLKVEGILKVNEVLPLTDRVLYGFFALSTYIVKFFSPIHLCSLYPYTILPGQPFPLIYYLNPLLILLLAFLVYKSACFTRVIVTGILFFLFNIVFMLQILSAGTTYLSDRYTYVAYTGLFFIAGWFIQQMSVKGNRKTLILSVVCLYSVFLIVLTFNRCKVWHDEETLWTDVINKYPEKHITPYFGRGDYYKANGQFDKALVDYEMVHKIDPREMSVMFRLGLTRIALKDYPGAISVYKKIISINPKITDAYQNMGALYCLEKDYDSAIAISLKGIRVDPGNGSFYANLGYYYIEKEDWKKASENYLACLKIDGKNLGANLGMAMVSFTRNDKGAAKNYLQKAQRIEPLMKKGMDGIAELEKSGYVYTDKVKGILAGMFEVLK